MHFSLSVASYSWQAYKPACLCHKSITTTRSFCRNLKQHSQNVSLYEEKHSNKFTSSYVELSSDNKHCMDEKETDGNANQRSVGNDDNIDKTNDTGRGWLYFTLIKLLCTFLIIRIKIHVSTSYLLSSKSSPASANELLDRLSYIACW